MRRDGDGYLEVVLEGELDLCTAPQLREVLAEVETDGRRARVELADCDLIDGSILEILVEAGHALTGAGGELVLHGPHGQVLRVLAQSGVLEVLKLDGGG